MKIPVKTLDAVGVMNPTPIRCPHCGHLGVLERIRDDAALGDSYFSGQRRCPNPDCHGLVFVVFRGGKLERCYPQPRIDFDTAHVPDEIKAALSEAIGCHAATCFVASAIMVRRTLEEICAKHGATGSTLRDRLRDLRTKVTLSTDLLEAMADLRLLGNDAAHVEAKTFLKVSKEEVEAAISLSKAIVTALYQHADLLAQLRALKK